MEASIIIPSTRTKGLKKTRESLLRQKTKFSYEIIAVENLLPGQARNRGAKRALGKYLLFIDDDCLASENWIENNINFLKTKKNIGAVGGKIVGKSPKFFSRCTDYTNFWRQQNNQLRKTSQLYTASLAVKKETFLKVSGFDEKAKVGEDVDFINKLEKHGYISWYNPEIVVLHDHKRDTFSKFLKYMYNNGLATGLYILKTHQRIALVRVLLPIFKQAYFLFIIPMAILYTGANLYLNFSSNWKIIFLLPFIFLGYLVYHLGIAVRLLKEILK